MARKCLLLVITVLFITGCAIGRSWDKPSIGVDEKLFNTDESIVIYSRDHANLIRSAFYNKDSKDNIVPFIIKELEASEEDRYPLITVKIEKPKDNDSLISYSFGLSILTFSILPGYTNEKSDISLELKIKNDKGHVESKSKTYVAKRHFFNWLLLLPFANYGSDMANGWGTLYTNTFWKKAYKYYIRKFLLEEKDLILRNEEFK